MTLKLRPEATPRHFGLSPGPAWRERRSCLDCHSEEPQANLNIAKEQIMKHYYYSTAALVVATFLTLLSSGCSSGKADPESGAPPPAQVEQEQDGGAFSVDHPEQFPLAAAEKYEARAGVKCYRHGQPGCFTKHPGGFARLGTHCGYSRPPWRHRDERATPDAGAKPGHFAGIFRLPAGGGG